jgi:hypothetical protein
MKISIELDIGPDGGILDLSAKLCQLTSRILQAGVIMPVNADGMKMRLAVEHDQHDRELREAMRQSIRPE